MMLTAKEAKELSSEEFRVSEILAAYERDLEYLIRRAADKGETMIEARLPGKPSAVGPAAVEILLPKLQTNGYCVTDTVTKIDEIMGSRTYTISWA